MLEYAVDDGGCQTTFEDWWNTNCHHEYRRSVGMFTIGGLSHDRIFSRISNEICLILRMHARAAVPFFLIKLCVISFIKFKCAHKHGCNAQLQTAQLLTGYRAAAAAAALGCGA